MKSNYDFRSSTCSFITVSIVMIEAVFSIKINLIKWRKIKTIGKIIYIYGWMLSIKYEKNVPRMLIY